jgi:hypothetical protein
VRAPGLPQADLEVELAFGLNLFRLNANFFGDSSCLTPETSVRKRHIARHVRTNVLHDREPPKRQRLNLL